MTTGIPDRRNHDFQARTEAWLGAILEAVDAGVHAVDREGITIFYNDKAGKLDGLEPTEVVGRHVLDVFPSLTNETSSLLRVLRTRETISHRRQSYSNFRGKQVHTMNTTRPVYVADQLIGALEIAWDITEMQNLAERVVDLQAARLEGNRSKREAARTTGAIWTLDDMVTRSPELIAVKALAQKVARTSSPVLVLGETGTGKELLVQGIHRASPRANAPFIAQNCGALPGTLLEGILFGTVKGSFTGAENRSGLFELANGGTLFLDELNSMPLDLQVKLLRVLEDGMIRRLGDNRVIPVDVRIVAAMNTEPEDAILAGALRPDLYYRVQVIALRLPPLMQRKDDIPLLIDHFIRTLNARFDKTVKGVSPGALDVLMGASWRGNVRELKHAIEAAMNMAEGVWLDIIDLPAYLIQDKGMGSRESFLNQGMAQGKLAPLPDRVMAYERRCVMEALEEACYNIALAAKILGLPRQTLQSKMKKLGVHRNGPSGDATS